MKLSKAIALTSVSTFALALAACGGGGGGTGGGTPVVTPTTVPVSNGRAATAISITVPASAATHTSSSGRTPQFISPGLDKLSFFIDGSAAFSDISVDSAPQPYTSSDGNTKATFACATGGAVFTCTLTVDTLPGSHTFGVVLKGGSPAIILSEGQATIALLPGNNAPATMPLLGVSGTGYIMCDTDAHVAANNGCQNSFDTTTGLYTLTAVAADFNGFPITYQQVSGNPVPFDNGTVTVVETGTSSGVITLSNNGPFSNPGNALTSQPSGGFFISGTFTYGNHFNVKCNKLGTATLGIENNHQGPTTPVSGQSYSYFDPSNNFPTQTAGSPDYPGAGTVARGSKFTGNPDYHSGNNPNAVHDITTVNCDANLVLTLI